MDKATKDYAVDLDQKLRDLHRRLKSGRYQVPEIRRVYVPKPNGKRPPIGISTLEDRMVQKAVAWVLGAVFEQDFLECSHELSQHRLVPGELVATHKPAPRHGLRVVRPDLD
jgi:retron-type reverse transcriptase